MVSTEVDAMERLRAFIAKYPTQQDAAHALGIKPPYLSDLVNGKRNLSDNVLTKLGLRRTVVRVRGAK